MGTHTLLRAVPWAALLLSWTTSTAQSRVWVVAENPGPGVDFTNLQKAVQASADGDLVLVRDGDYAGFTIEDRGIVVTAEVGADVHTASLRILDLSAGKTVVLRGLQAQAPSGAGTALTVRNCAGSVWIEDCILRGGVGDNDFIAPFDPLDSYAGARVQDSVAVSFARCDLFGGAGLDVCEGPVGDALLFGADEVFLTSSIKEVVPVVQLEGRALGDGRPGPTTRHVRQLFRGGVQRILDAGAARLSEVFGE